MPTAFRVLYNRQVSGWTTIHAENEAEARAKFARGEWDIDEYERDDCDAEIVDIKGETD